MPDHTEKLNKSTFNLFQEHVSDKLELIHSDIKAIDKILVGNGELGFCARVINLETAKAKTDRRIWELVKMALPWAVTAITAGSAAAWHLTT